MTQSANNLLQRQFSLKQFLIFITVFCAIVFWALLSWRRMKYRDLSEWHRTRSFGSVSFPESMDKDWKKSFAEKHTRYTDHHRRMYEKYKRAANYPWISVESDPPEPPNPMVTMFK